MERYKEGPYFQEIQEIWPFLIPFHTFPIRSIAMEIQSFSPVFLLSFDCNHFGHIPHASGCGQVFAVLLNEHSVTLGHMLLKVATGASIYKAPADVL